MEKFVTVVGENGVEYAVSLTAQQADYYLRLAQLRASFSGDLMKEFSNLLISKGQQDKAQYN